MIKFNKVTKKYDGTIALEEITFEVKEGDFTFLIGPSGCGKTTIIKLLIKEEVPTQGSVHYYSYEVPKLNNKLITELRREIGVIFQDFKLLQHKTIFENIAFAMEASGKKDSDIQETIPFLLDLVGLADRSNAFPQELSGGEKQKIAIARAMANDPRVLVADEPTGNLDEESEWEIVNLLKKINEGGTTVVMATHGSDIVRTLDKRTIRLDNGKIVEDNLSDLSSNLTSMEKTQENRIVIEKQEKDQSDLDEDLGKDLEMLIESGSGSGSGSEGEGDGESESESEGDGKGESEDEDKSVVLDKTGPDEDQKHKKENDDQKQKNKKNAKSKRDKNGNEKIRKKRTNINLDKIKKPKKITFSTKKPSQTSGRKNELNLLKLPNEIKELLTKHRITKISKLLETSDEKLLAIEGITDKSLNKIKKAIKDFNK